jgi:diaminopimelate decarboxylase
MSFSSGESTALRRNHVSGAHRYSLPGHLADHPTPLHVFFEKEALEDASELEKGLKSGLPGAELFYSVKTNPLLPLLRGLVRLGWGLEVVGEENFRAALESGCDPGKLLYNGAAWDLAELEEALYVRGIRRFTVDSASQAATLAQAWGTRPHGPALEVAVRLHDGESHFGVPAWNEPLGKVLRQFPDNMVSQLGFHAHRNPAGSPETLEQLRGDFSARAHFVLTALKALHGTNWGKRVAFFNFGGGIDSPHVFRPHPRELGAFHDPAKAPEFRERAHAKRFTLQEAGAAAADAVKETLGAELGNRRVLFEPGRAVCTRALSTLVTVTSVKSDFYPNQEVVLTDGNTAALGPLHRGVYPLSPTGDEPTFVYGNLPHAADWLFQNVKLPKLDVGDRILIRHTGAYFLALEARFGHALPVIVRADRDEKLR